MPAYEYHCPANGRTIEVLHGMDASISTWGEACALASIDPGDTLADMPVDRALSAILPIRVQAEPSQGCGPGCGCHGN